MILNHGIGGHAETFARNVRALSEHFRVYAVDAVFHGYSGKEDFDLPHMYDSLAEGYIDLIDALGYRSAHFIGESMGAQTGVQLGVKYPERVDRLVLNSGFFQNKPARTDFRPASSHGGPSLGELSARAVNEPTRDNIAARLAWLVADPARVTEDMVSVRQQIYRDPEVNASMRKVFNLDGGGFSTDLFDLRYDDSVLDAWKSEALCLWGEHNPGFGPDFGEYWAERVGLPFYLFDDAGHWPHWEKPDEYNAVVIQYLTQ